MPKPKPVSRMPRTTLVSYRIAGCLFVLMFASLLPIPLDAAQGGKMEILPVQKAAPAAVVI